MHYISLHQYSSIACSEIAKYIHNALHEILKKVENLENLTRPNQFRLPCDTEAILTGHGVWASALTHSVDLKKRNVQAHEVLKRVLGDGSCAGIAGLATVKAQGKAHLCENQFVGKREAPRHDISPGRNRGDQLNI